MCISNSHGFIWAGWPMPLSTAFSPSFWLEKYHDSTIFLWVSVAFPDLSSTTSTSYIKGLAILTQVPAANRETFQHCFDLGRDVTRGHVTLLWTCKNAQHQWPQYTLSHGPRAGQSEASKCFWKLPNSQRANEEWLVSQYDWLSGLGRKGTSVMTHFRRRWSSNSFL